MTIDRRSLLGAAALIGLAGPALAQAEETYAAADLAAPGRSATSRWELPTLP